jgi:uncharacterized membrane protein
MRRRSFANGPAAARGARHGARGARYARRAAAAAAYDRCARGGARRARRLLSCGTARGELGGGGAGGGGVARGPHPELGARAGAQHGATHEPLGVRCSAAARHLDERSIRAPSRARAGGHPLGTARYCSVHAPTLVQCHIHLLKVRGRAAQDKASARDDAFDGARDGAALASVIPTTPTNPTTPTRRVIWCMRRRRGRIRSGAVAGAYGATSGGGSGSTSSSTKASHGHGRAVVGSSSSSSGGQARHAPLWARHGALSAALLLKDSLCVVHLFEDARRIGTTLSSPPTTETTGRRTGRDQPRRTGRRDALVHANGTEMARAVSGAVVAASVTPLVNFGRVHVSLLVLLRCVPPSARAVAGAEQEHAARLSLRLLAQLPRLPPPRLKAGQLPPFASPDSRGHSGELPRPGAASSAPTTRVIWCKRHRPQPRARYGTRWAQHGARNAQYGARWARRTQLARCAV